MNFGLTETQQTLKKTTRQFLTAECPPAEVRRLMETDTAFDAALVAARWPSRAGPASSSRKSTAASEWAWWRWRRCLEEMGRALLPGPFLSTVLLAGSAIAYAGSDAQKQQYLKAICEGSAKATLALLEEGASWSTDSVHLHASAGAGGYVLSGRKLFVPDAAVADFLICAARLRGSAGAVHRSGGNARREHQGHARPWTPPANCTK